MARAVDVRARWGPWAVIAGASDGVGEELAVTLAREGVGSVLLARRAEQLERVADRVRALGAEARVVPVDLAGPGATATIAEATADLEVGLLVCCAGADADYRPFLDSPIATAESMIERNCTVPLRLVHHFAPAMVARRRGGVVIVGSGAGFVGAPNMVAYAATKAFDMIVAEALWAELKPHGVDVIGLLLGETDTPSLRRLRFERGLAATPDEPVASATPVAEVVATLLAGLPKGPTVYVGRQMRRAGRLMQPIPRALMVKGATRAGAKVMGGP